MKLTKEVVIHGFQFSTALRHLLGQSMTLGKHTNVLHFSPETVTKYLWTQKSYQPWGKRLALQCPRCGILNPWLTVFVQDGARKGYRVECANTRCGGDSGRYSFNIWRPANAPFVSVGEGGWLVLDNYDNSST